MLQCNRFCLGLQEVTDLVEKVTLATELVRRELKQTPAQVTVTIECTPEATQELQAPQPVTGSLTMHQAVPLSQGVPKQGTHVLHGQQQQQQQGTPSEHLAQEPIQIADAAQVAQQQPGGLPSRETPQHQLILVQLVSDNYHDVMTETLQEVESDLKLCWQLLQQCRESFSCLVSFYGENAQAFANDGVFWSDVTTFVDRFTACQKQLRKQIQVKCGPILHLEKNQCCPHRRHVAFDASIITAHTSSTFCLPRSHTAQTLILLRTNSSVVGSVTLLPLNKAKTVTACTTYAETRTDVIGVIFTP